MKNKFFGLVMMVFVLVGLTGCSYFNKEDEGPIKVGLLLTSSPDNSYSEGAYGYSALKYLESKYGVEIAYNENVTNKDNASYLLSSYGKNGFDLVIGIGSLFNEPMLNASESYTDTQFVCINGDKSEKNVTTYQLAEDDVSLLAGYIAGFLTKVDSIGYVVKDNTLYYSDSLAKGAKSVNNSIILDKYLVKNSGNYIDIVNSLSSKGDTAAVLFLTSKDLENSLTGAGVKFLVVGGKAEPDAKFPVIAYNYNNIFERIFIDFNTGNLKGKTVELGFKEGYIQVASLEGLSSDVKIKVESLVKSFE